jgi:uncharacterized protein
MGLYPFQRLHSNESIDLQAAKDGLDYIYRFIKNRKNKKFSIGFYGGEPLIEIDVIKEIVDYAKRLFKDWELRFNITTNASAMNEKIIDFFIDNRFNVSISIDGPEENHNAKRVFPDGKGTFKTVMDNLEELRNKDENYYIDNVSFSTVYSNDLSLEKLYLFFIENDLVNRNAVRFNRVNSLNTTYYDKYPYDRGKNRREFNKIFNIILGKQKQKEDLFPIEKSIFETFTGLMENLKVKRTTILAGACLFNNRLYIDVNGRFHLCEKMNDKFPFGDVKSGLDFAKMIKIVRDFAGLIKRNCLDCGVRFLCRRCYIHFARDGRFSMDPEFCESQQKLFNRLEKILDLKEENVI